MNQTPTRLFILLVDNDAFNGAYKKNPLNFKTQDLIYLSLMLNGKEIAGKPLKPDFTNLQYARSYYGLMEALGLVNNVEGGNVLEYKDFAEGFCIYGFDLSPSRVDGSEIELIKSGSIRIEFQFSAGLAVPVNVMCMGILDSIVEIDKSRQILVDF